MDIILTTADKTRLMEIAREAIDQFLEDGSLPVETPQDMTASIKSNGGSFVSVYIGEDLRGCIGTFSEEDPLWKSVRRMAVSAVSRDSRFKPLNVTDINHYELEISVLTERKLIHDIEEIIIGKHGIYIISGSNRGTLLPQVAVNHGWTREEFLGNCSKYKAGIGWNGWKDSSIYIYEAIVFGSHGK